MKGGRVKRGNERSLRFERCRAYGPRFIRRGVRPARTRWALNEVGWIERLSWQCLYTLSNLLTRIS